MLDRAHSPAVNSSLFALSKFLYLLSRFMSLPADTAVPAGS